MNNSEFMYVSQGRDKVANILLDLCQLHHVDQFGKPLKDGLNVFVVLLRDLITLH